MRLLLSLLVLLLLPALSHAYRPGNDTGQSDTSIYQECLWNKETMSTDVVCNDLYNHYLPEKSRYRPSGDVRLGSYNIFRSYEQQQKRWDLTAKMINDEWDVVAFSELQPNKSALLQSNVNAHMALEDGKIKKADFKKAYFDPSYVTMLKELQKLDPSWALIITPYTQSNADTELFAFAYRANQVKIQESKYCKAKYVDDKSFDDDFIWQEIRAEKYLKGSGSSEGIVKSDNGKPISDRSFEYPENGKAYACVLRVEEFAREGNFNKIPFVARFQSGDFDFSYLSVHLGFRGPKEIKNECEEECQRHIYELTTHALKDVDDKDELIAKLDKIGLATSKKYSDKRAKEVDEENDAIAAHNKANPKDKKPKIVYGFGRETSRKMIRFFQIQQIMAESLQMRELNDDNDVIISGDFNLGIGSGWQKLYWEKLSQILGKESAVFVETKTSISEKNGYSHPYDHFVFNPSSKHVGECKVDTAASFDFLDESIETSDGFELGKEIEKYQDEDNFEELANILTQSFQDKKWVSSQGDLFDYDDLKKVVDKADGTEFRSLQVEVTQVCDTKGTKKEKKWMNIVDAQINETYCKFHKGVENDNYFRFMFTLSDHLPIGMTCEAK